MSSDNFGFYVALAAACPPRPLPLDGTEVVPVVVSSVTYQTTIADIVGFALMPTVVIGTAYDTGERYATVNAFGTNAPPTYCPGASVPPGQPAIMARNGFLTDIIYGYMNKPTSDGGDGAGLKLRLIGDPYNPAVITELAFGRYSTDLDTNGTVIIRSLQDIQLVANYNAEAGEATRLSLSQDGSAMLTDLSGNHLRISPAGVFLSSMSATDLEVMAGACLRLEAANLITIASQNDNINIGTTQTLFIGTGQDINISAGKVIRLYAPALLYNDQPLTFNLAGGQYDTGERYASLNAFGTNAPPTYCPGGLVPPGQPAIMARNGFLTDIIYGYMNVPTSGGGDGAGLKLRLIGDPNNPAVITELAFDRNNTNLASNANITLRSLQDVQLIANYKDVLEGGGPFTGLSLLQDGSAELFDIHSNYLSIAPSLVALSSHGSNCDLEVNSGAVLRLQATYMVHISSASDDVNLTTTRSFNVGVGKDINLIAAEIINLAAPAIRFNTPKLGFFGVTPVTQGSRTAIGTSIELLLDFLQNIGLLGP